MNSMEENCRKVLPEELLDKIFLAAGIDECYLRPISTMSKPLLSISNHFKRTLNITPSNAHCLPKLLERFPNIKHVIFPSSINPARFFGDISQFNISLESLDMSLSSFPIKEFKKLPLSGLQATLKSLKLSHVQDETDVDGDLEILAELFPNLEELELFRGCKVTNKGVARLSSKLKRLRKVTIAGNSLITNASIKSLVQNCLDLEEIALKDCLHISAPGISFIFRNCRELRSFVMQGRFDIGKGRVLALARNLTSLEFSSMFVSDELLHAIARAKIPLKRVSLSDCSGFTLDGIIRLLGVYHCHLEYFAIENASLGPEFVDHIAAYLRNAKTVKLNHCCQLSRKQLLGLICNCLQLNTLEVKGGGITSQDQDQEDPNTLQCDRVSHSQLRSLDLSYNATVSDQCLVTVSKVCPYLSHLFVESCKAITQKGLSEITRNCLGLKTIQMNMCVGVFTLGLEIKVSDWYRLEVLEAISSSLDDECLKVIALKCPDLMCLDVTNCQYVTALGVREVVMKCKNLERLGISFNKIDPATQSFITSKKLWLVKEYI